MLLIGLIATQAFAIDSTWKSDIDMNMPYTSNTSISLQMEFENEIESDKDISYNHLQILLEQKVGWLTIAPGYRGIDTGNGTDRHIDSAMLDLKTKTYMFKHRLRYVYGFIDGSDNEPVYRYRLNTDIKLPYKLVFSPGAELFYVDSFDYKRIRYGGYIGRKFGDFKLEFGYEYNDNHNKENSQTVVTTLGVIL